MRTLKLWTAAVLALAAFPLAADAQSSARPPTPVEAASVETRALDIETTAVGSLLSNETVIVRPEIEGRLVEISFEEGKPVEKGQLLFKLDDSIYRAELADAMARLDLAKNNYDRAKELLAKNAGTARGRDEARSDYQVAEAAVHLARARLTKTTIEAPFDGTVGLRQVSVGDYVSPGQDLVNLESLDPLKVQFSVPERYLPAIKTGQTVLVGADAFPGQSFEGEIYAINPQIDTAGRSVQVRALLPNTDGALRPGLFVRVSVKFGRRDDAIMIPEDALVPRGKDRFVYLIVDGKAKETAVKTGQRRFGLVEVVHGLAPGDVVITAGQLKIRDGAPVQAVNIKPAETPAKDAPKGSGDQPADAAGAGS